MQEKYSEKNQTGNGVHNSEWNVLEMMSDSDLFIQQQMMQ